MLTLAVSVVANSAWSQIGKTIKVEHQSDEYARVIRELNLKG